MLVTFVARGNVAEATRHWFTSLERVTERGKERGQNLESRQ